MKSNAQNYVSYTVENIATGQKMHAGLRGTKDERLQFISFYRNYKEKGQVKYRIYINK